MKAVQLLLLLGEVVAPTGFVGGCASFESRLKDDLGLAELRVIQDADPRVAAEAAWARGDRQFLGIAGFSVEVPGAEEHYEKVVRPAGVRVLSGTSDQASNEVAALFPKARTYATIYNQTLLEKWSAAQAQ